MVLKVFIVGPSVACSSAAAFLPFASAEVAVLAFPYLAFPYLAFLYLVFLAEHLPFSDLSFLAVAVYSVPLLSFPAGSVLMPPQIVLLFSPAVHLFPVFSAVSFPVLSVAFPVARLDFGLCFSTAGLVAVALLLAAFRAFSTTTAASVVLSCFSLLWDWIASVP